MMDGHLDHRVSLVSSELKTKATLADLKELGCYNNDYECGNPTLYALE